MVIREVWVVKVRFSGFPWLCSGPTEKDKRRQKGAEHVKGISPAIYKAQNPENPKSLQTVSQGEFGIPRPSTPKKFEQNPKVKQIVDFRILLELSGHHSLSPFTCCFRRFFGVHSRAFSATRTPNSQNP